MDYTIRSLIGGFRWQTPVYGYKHLDPAPDWITQLEHVWPRLKGGVFVAVGVTTPQPLRPRRVYDAVDSQDTNDSQRVFAAATAVEYTTVDALLTFVNRYGLLGCASPRDADQLYDSVALTAECLQKFQRLAGWMEALKRREYTAPAVPSMTALRRRLKGVRRGRLSDDEKNRIRWQGFVYELRQVLAGRPIQADYRVINGVPGIEQIWTPRCLADVLFLTLWQHATDGDQQPRRCNNCGGMFFARTSNQRKIYCSYSCKRNASVHRFREKKKRIERLKK